MRNEVDINEMRKVEAQLHLPLELKDGDIFLVVPSCFRAGYMNNARVLKAHEIQAVIRFLDKAREKKLDLSADFDIHRKRKSYGQREYC